MVATRGVMLDSLTAGRNCMATTYNRKSQLTNTHEDRKFPRFLHKEGPPPRPACCDVGPSLAPSPSFLPMPFCLRSFWHTFKGASCYAALAQPLVRPATATAPSPLTIDIDNQCGHINPALRTSLTPGEGYSRSPTPFCIPTHPLVTNPTCPEITTNNNPNNNMTVTAHYYFAGYPNIIFGQRVEPQYTLQDGKKSRSWNTDKAAAGRNFQPAPGVYRARDLVSMSAPLLDTCIRRVSGGEDSAAQESAREVLLAGLAAILATSGRESSLALRGDGRAGGSSDEMARQADAIGAALVGYAREAVDPDGADGDFKMVSHCDGHLWTHDVVGVLMGPRGDQVAMQLYNEWSHRLVLLRNALLPFENWDEVPLVVPADDGDAKFSSSQKRGMRALEGPSDAFVMRLLSGRTPQTAIVDMAKALTARGLPSGGFGFQYTQGTVLPAFLAGSASRSLLRFYPARVPESAAAEVLYDYEHPSYDDAERSEMPAPTAPAVEQSDAPNAEAALPGTVASVLRSRPVPGSQGPRSTLHVEVELRGHPEAVFPVCLGQIARGRRFAARPHKIDDAADRGAAAPAPAANIVLHRVEDALSLPGLVFSAAEGQPGQQQRQQQENTLHVFPVSDPLLGLALFGKLYPGNVVVLGENDDLARALGVGRGFGTKFVHWPRP